MKRILVLFALFAAAAGYAQTVEKQTFVYAVKQTDTLRLDRYVALTPDSRTKPCLMFVFGGGFVGGRRDNASFLSYFEYYARKGYVVVSIDYRLGMKKAMQAGTLSEETFPEAWITTLAMATGDLYDATAYVCDHASAWGVDKTRIVASGSSAGAITVLMGEYGICNGHPLARQKLPQDFNYAGVISYAGAIFDTQEELRWAKTPAPMMLFHGDADRNVPYDAVLYDGCGLQLNTTGFVDEARWKSCPDTVGLYLRDTFENMMGNNEKTAEQRERARIVYENIINGNVVNPDWQGS